VLGPFYIGQVPADPLVITVRDDEGQPRDLTGYDTISLLMYDDFGVSVDTSAGTVDPIDPAVPSRVIYHWPPTSLFTAIGEYSLQFALDGPGTVHDLTGVAPFAVVTAGEFPILPTVSEFASFWGQGAPIEDATWDADAASVLQQSVDLLYLTTRIVDVPKEPHQARLVKYAIMDMAIYLHVSGADVVENYSSFSGERLGSYSYSKVLKQAERGETGVFWWDALVGAFILGEFNDAATLIIEGEQVFHRGYSTPMGDELLLHAAPLPFGVSQAHDPVPGTDAWLPFGSTNDGSWAFP